MSPLMPWPTLGDVPAPVITNIEIDGEPAFAPPIDGPVILGGDDGFWQHAEMTVTLEIPTEKWPDDIEPREAEATFVLVCRTTNLMTGTSLPLNGEPGRWSGRIVMSADLVGDTADGFIEVTTGPRTSPRVVGKTDVIRFSTRRPDPLELAGPSGIAWEWFDFSAPQTKTGREHLIDTPTLPFFVDFSEPDPVLCLNSGIPGFQATVEDGSAASSDRALADLLSAHVAAGTASALVLNALQSSGLDGEMVTPPPSVALSDALRAAAAEMPDVADTDELIRQYHTAVQRDEAASAALIAARAAMAAASAAQLGPAVAAAAKRARQAPR